MNVQRRSRAASMVQNAPTSQNDPAPAYTGSGSNAVNAVDPEVTHPPYAGQSEVYEYVGRPVLENTLDGYNGCVFAYGQTGSGKTFTMMGYAPKKKRGEKEPVFNTESRAAFSPTEEGEEGGDEEEEEEVIQSTSDPNDLQGIIPRISKQLFEGLQKKRSEDESLSYRIEVSYFEIYNEKVFDLIRPQTDDLKIRNNPSTGPYVEGLTSKVVTTEEDVAKIIRKGTSERHTAATKYNDRSSRSHAILNFNIVQLFLEEGDTLKMQSKLNLVDLAGSERTGKGGAEGIEKKTGININLSLTVLGRVIGCLADLSQNKSLAVPVPYRESNLTWLLSDSIGGNSQTSMVATISPHTLNYEEMRQTIRYASRAKQIIQKAIRNEDPQIALIKHLQAEVEDLQIRLKEAGGSEYTREYVLGLEKKIKQLEKKVVEQERIIGGLRALLEGAGIADPTAEDGYTDDAVANKAALAAKKAKEEAEKKMEKAQMTIAELKAELERRSEIQPDELIKLRDQLSKQAKAMAAQRHEIGNYKDLLEMNYINDVMLKVVEKENYFFQEYALQMMNSKTSVVDAMQKINAQREGEMEQMKARHQELLAEQAQQFQARIKRAMEDADKEQE
ncbi:kinesin, partial [Angomonas deanei]